MAPPEVSDRDVPPEQVVKGPQKENWFTDHADAEMKKSFFRTMVEQPSDKAYTYSVPRQSAYDIQLQDTCRWLYEKSLPSVRVELADEHFSYHDIIKKEGVNTEKKQSSDLHACVNSSDSPSQNDPLREANAVKVAFHVKKSILALKRAGVIKPSLMQQQANCKRRFNSTEANNSRLVIDQLRDETRTPGLVICGDYHESRSKNKWKAGTTFFSVEKLMKELSSNNKLTFGGYEEKPPPSSTKQRKPAPPPVATSKDLRLKYEDSLVKNETTAHNDQRSNRDRKKAQKGAPSCELDAPFSGSERRSVPSGKHHTENQSVRYQSGSKQQHPIEKRQLTQQSLHHSSKSISEEPSDSTHSPSSSRPKKGGNGSSYSSKKRGGASNQGGATLDRGSGSGEENGDGLPPDDNGKNNQGEASQANEKEEPPIPPKQELHILQVRQSSISSQTPPEAVRTKVNDQQVCSNPPPTSPVMPGPEVQSQNPSAIIYDDAGGQPRLKPPLNTLATPGAEDFSQNPPANIHHQAATEPRSCFNVKPPPDSQVSHGAKVSSRLLSEIEWDEPNPKLSASTSVLEDTRRDSLDYAATPLKDFRLPLTPATQLIDEKPHPDNELPWTNVAPDRIAEDLASNEVVPIEESPSVEPGLPSPALPTHVFDNLDLFSLQESESNAEFCPFPFTALAGDDGLLPPQPSSGNSQVEATLDDAHDFYQHPIEEAGNLEGHPTPQEGAINDTLTHTTLGSRVVSPLHDIWIFIALVDVSGPINGERGRNS